jgi:hypothetical protein
VIGVKGVQVHQGEDPDDFGLAHTQVTYRAVGVLRDMQLLQALCERIFTTWCAIEDLTKKGEFKWSEEAHEAFDRMKKVMSTFPVLALPDFSQPFVLECDASREGIGAMLMQN